MSDRSEAMAGCYATTRRINRDNYRTDADVSVQDEVVNAYLAGYAQAIEDARDKLEEMA
jgi:hypothetical protein